MAAFLYRDDLQETKIGIFSIKYEVKTNPAFFPTGYLSLSFFFRSGWSCFVFLFHTHIIKDRGTIDFLTFNFLMEINAWRRFCVGRLYEV